VAFVDGVTAAAIGATTAAVIVLGQRSITDFVTAALAILTVAVLWGFKNVPEHHSVFAIIRSEREAPRGGCSNFQPGCWRDICAWRQRMKERKDADA
jgi:hypothetical protein